MVIGHGITIGLEHDNATGEYSDYITIEIQADDERGYVHTHTGSRHVESTLTHEELRNLAMDILRMLKRVKAIGVRREAE